MGWIKKINWTLTLFLLLTPVVGVAGTAFIVASGRLQIATVVLALVWMAATGLAITAGYHRLFSHCTYRAKWLLRLFVLLFGAGAYQGSVLEWCTDHRNHHRYSETDKDPYNIEKGFWFAHIGWLLTLDPSTRDFSNVEDLAADKWILWQHKNWWWLALTWGFVMPTLIAGVFWGDWLGGLLLAGVLRLVLNHHATFCINSVCHVFGKRAYSLEQTGRDNWITAFFTYGEGFHNFHHQFPLDYRNGIRIYDYDPTKWIIWVWSRLGLASDLKTISLVHLTRYRLRTDELALLTRFKQGSDAVMSYIHEQLLPLRSQILQVMARIDAIEKSGKIKEYRDQLKIARSELRYSLSIWTRTKARLLEVST
jgi:stearoyl-CoA desaturase (Delta-9 desaturase)